MARPSTTRTAATKKRARTAVQEEERDVVTDMLQQFGAVGYRVKLNRQSETPPRPWQYVATMDLTGDLVEEVKELYGGGNYRALIHDGKKYLRGGTIPFSIAGKAKTPGEETTAPGSDRLARIEASVEKLSTKDGDSTVKVVAMITSIIGALTPIVIPLLDRKPAGGENVATTINMLHEAEARGEKRGRELGTLLAGGGDGGIGDALKTYMPPLLNLVGENVKARRQANATAASAPIASAPALPAEPATPLPPEYAWLDGLRPFYGRLLGEAQEDSDPELIADFALSKMSDALRDAIEASALRPDFRDVMRRELAPIAAAHSEWLEQFLTRIVDSATPEPPALVTTPSTRGRKKA